MRARRYHISGMLAIVLLAGCGATDEADVTIPAFAVAEASHFRGTPMRGRNEVPPVPSHAAGNATFTLSRDGTAIRYKLIVANIDDVTQSHIHIAPEGVNGPVVVFLFGFVAGGVTKNGVLAEGTFTEANLIARPAIGFGGTMAELLTAMRSGNAYVNVHTVAYPGGEIRAQVH
jgi:hypothetical protein